MATNVWVYYLVVTFTQLNGRPDYNTQRYTESQVFNTREECMMYRLNRSNNSTIYSTPSYISDKPWPKEHIYVAANNCYRTHDPDFVGYSDCNIDNSIANDVCKKNPIRSTNLPKIPDGFQLNE